MYCVQRIAEFCCSIFLHFMNMKLFENWLVSSLLHYNILSILLYSHILKSINSFLICFNCPSFYIINENRKHQLKKNEFLQQPNFGVPAYNTIFPDPRHFWWSISSICHFPSYFFSPATIFFWQQNPNLSTFLYTDSKLLWNWLI